MKILITGANGFIGKNLYIRLLNHGIDKNDIYRCDVETSADELKEYTKDCGFVFHLAGINRPQNDEDFIKGNFGFTGTLLDNLKENGNKCPVLVTSSIQAELDNPYGKSKKMGEDLLFRYSEEQKVKVLCYRLPNVFGKWCRPNYNSAVATFCHNIAHNLDITVNDENHIMNLVYIDDVVNEFIKALDGKENRNGAFCFIPLVYTVKLGEIAKLLYSFRETRKNLGVPKLCDSFEKILYSTYLSYLPENKFSYPVKMNSDARGSFTELIRTPDRGQFSVNISKPGITKGNHYHHTKNEKFVVVHGKGLIQFRKISGDGEKVIDYHVNGEKIEVVDIPVGYTHNIINEGEDDLVTFMWCNECFDPENPDTYYEEV